MVVLADAAAAAAMAWPNEVASGKLAWRMRRATIVKDSDPATFRTDDTTLSIVDDNDDDDNVLLSVFRCEADVVDVLAIMVLLVFVVGFSPINRFKVMCVVFFSLLFSSSSPSGCFWDCDTHTRYY